MLYSEIKYTTPEGEELMGICLSPDMQLVNETIKEYKKKKYKNIKVSTQNLDEPIYKTN